MDFSSPSLAEAAPKYFAQMDFVDDLDTSKTSFDFFEEAIENATEGRKDRDSYDDGLLSEIVAFEDLFHHGVNKIEIQNGRRPVTIVHERLETVRKLRRETPQPQRVMVAGQLNTVSYNERAFVLLLPDGTRIKGSADAIGPEQLKKFLGKPSVLHGNAVFRPSGTVLRIEADRIEAPQKNDIEVFGREPSPLRGRAAESRTIDQAQGPRSGINAVFGKWPGDETEDELIEYLERLSS